MKAEKMYAVQDNGYIRLFVGDIEVKGIRGVTINSSCDSLGRLSQTININDADVEIGALLPSGYSKK